MFLFDMSESGYLSNAFLTKLIPGVDINGHQKLIFRPFFHNYDKRSLVFFTKLSCLIAIGFKWESIYADLLYDTSIV